MRYSNVDVFHGKDLDKVVNEAQANCPLGYEMVNLKVDWLNNEWIVVAKIKKGGVF